MLKRSILTVASIALFATSSSAAMLTWEMSFSASEIIPILGNSTAVAPTTVVTGSAIGMVNDSIILGIGSETVPTAVGFFQMSAIDGVTYTILDVLAQVTFLDGNLMSVKIGGLPTVDNAVVRTNDFWVVAPDFGPSGDGSIFPFDFVYTSQSSSGFFGTETYSATFSVVPEPSTALMMGLGLLVLSNARARTDFAQLGIPTRH